CLLNEIDTYEDNMYDIVMRTSAKLAERKKYFQLIPYDFLKLTYPLYKKDLVLYLSRKFSIEPLMVYSIIREESHFRPDAMSQAGAFGLMQLMEPTAKYIYDKKKLSKYFEFNMKDEVLNLQIGIQYFSDLLAYYDNNYIYALAAYNGGRGNVDKWIKKYKGSILDFVLFIPFDQTERYVKKVLKTYYIYTCLYGDKVFQD
ncbi:lytic transglycosylase domain-containing protein, partial [Spirochaetota bacterium]